MTNTKIQIYKRGIAIDRLSKVEEDIIKYLFEKSNENKNDIIEVTMVVNIKELIEKLNQKHNELKLSNKDIINKINDIYHVFIMYDNMKERDSLSILTYMKASTEIDDKVLVKINMESQDFILDMLN